MRRSSFAIIATAALALAACKGERADQASLDTLDKELVGNAGDPALTAALEDQIMVDPALTAQRGTGSARPTPGGLSQPVPPEQRRLQTQANYALANGKLLRTPAAGKYVSETGGAATLGQLAASQKAGAAGAHGCADKLDYSARWAARLPEEMRVYPQARVVEAAGGNEAPCRLRVVTFRADAAMQSVLDYYYTKALKAGYSSEHLEDGTDHMLGGTRRDDAYMLFLRALPGGGTEVDLISNVAA